MLPLAAILSHACRTSVPPVHAPRALTNVTCRDWPHSGLPHWNARCLFPGRARGALLRRKRKPEPVTRVFLRMPRKWHLEQMLRMPPPPRSAATRLALTALLVGMCFLMTLGLHMQAGVLGFYLTFPAIFAASVLFGRDAGMFGIALSTALLYLVVRPAHGVLPSGELVLALLVYVAVALGLALVSDGLRSAWHRAAAAEHAKDLLLQELGHRIKNNLAMAISMLALQAQSKTNPDVRAALEKAVLRIQAIARAQDFFNPGSHNGRVAMQPYLQNICEHLTESLREVRAIAVKVDADEIDLPAERAIPLGLIVNELLTNALKHAFPNDRPGTVEVRFRYGSQWELIVEDDGVGYPVDKQERLGSRLMRLLAQQLGAEVRCEKGRPGCVVRVAAPQHPSRSAGAVRHASA
jgi:two-component sensor histidine kinase